MRTVDEGHAPGIDRRSKVRLALSIPVYLLRLSTNRTVASRTKNISSEGFYCVVQETFSIGESVRCIIVVPAFDPHRPEELMFLKCHATVLRVDLLEGGSFGTAFHMNGYKVVPHMTRNLADDPADLLLSGS